MEDRGRQHRRRVTFDDALDQMIQRPDAARGDHRDGDGVGDGAGQRQIEAFAGAVPVHRGQQDLARA